MGISDFRLTTGKGRIKKDRGVALIIVLLVTALLIALIFEFAYGTRISLRSAVNFRDSQRAYYLARSGVSFAGLLLSYNLTHSKPQDNIEQRDWQPVPIMTGSNDTLLQVRWEDESGKINVSQVIKPPSGSSLNPADTYSRLVILFTNKGIGQDKLDLIAAWQHDESRKFYLLTELHQFLNDEDFGKVCGRWPGDPDASLTLAPVTQININTASVDVLRSIGVETGMAQRIVERRNSDRFKTAQEIADFLGPTNTMAAGQLTTTSNVFKVNSYATVGGFTKQVEAVITRSSSGSTPYTVNYWRAL